MTTQTTPRAPGVAGGVMSALESAWAAIRARHPEVPEVVVTMGAGTVNGRGTELTLGHYAPRRWVGAAGRLPELFVGAEGLRDGAREVMCTLLHEAAHALGDVRGVETTSRQGRYHNGRYRDLAIEVGLEVTRDQTHGWTETIPSPATIQTYAPVIAALDAVLIAWRVPEHDVLPITPAPAPGPGAGASGTAVGTGQDRTGESGRPTAGPREKNGVVATCGCPRRIRVTRSVLDLGPITCGICRQDFTALAPGADSIPLQVDPPRSAPAPVRPLVDEPATPAAPAPSQSPAHRPVSTIEERLRAAYLRLAEVRGDWVRLAQVRELLGDLDQDTLTAELTRLERTPDVHIVPAIDQSGLTRADHDAAVTIGGKKKYLLRID